MYPKMFGLFDSLFFMIFIGLVAAVIIYRFLSVTFKITDSAFFRFGIILLVSIAMGFIFAFLFQAFYNVLAGKKTAEEIFRGITFMGGLVGGVATFFIISLAVLRGESRKQIWNLVCLAPAAVAAAHGFGRIGCFLAGCCYGIKTDSFLGIKFPGHAHKVLPTQLFEAIFLFLLCAVLLVLIFKFKRYSLTMIVYLFSYSVFRFIIEFWRGDYRGGAGLVSPSQWQSVFMFLCAVALTVYIFRYKRIPFNGKQEGDLSKFLYESKPARANGNDENAASV